MSDSRELLRSYAIERSEQAFAEFVQRHLNLVYFTALRRTSGAQEAEEVSQEVFSAVARQAEALGYRRVMLLDGGYPAWQGSAP